MSHIAGEGGRVNFKNFMLPMSRSFQDLYGGKNSLKLAKC